MFVAGNTIVHSHFPEWGKGVITAVFRDTQMGKPIAKIMWESPKHGIASLHTFDHLKRIDECDDAHTAFQMVLPFK